MYEIESCFKPNDSVRFQLQLCTLTPRQCIPLPTETQPVLSYTENQQFTANISVSAMDALLKGKANRAPIHLVVFAHAGKCDSQGAATATETAQPPPLKRYLLDPILRPGNERVVGINPADTTYLHADNGDLLLWKPDVSVHLMTTPTKYASITDVEKDLQRFVGNDLKLHLPLIVASSLTGTRDDYIPLNITGNTDVPLRVTFKTTQPSRAFWFFRLEYMMNSGNGLLTPEDFEEVKRIFVETSPIVLRITIIISVLHTIFEILAYKDDISFWRHKSDSTGISMKSKALSIVTDFVTFLYLRDNGSSILVVAPPLLSIALNLWVIIKFHRKTAASHQETGEYDRLAFRYLSVFLVPILIGYCAYTLLFVPQKGWYSWVLSSLTSFIYALGFIMMTPQLFINHKLKSVAHLPWRALTYRALNTFIDDFFSFIIKMPTMHRISCFRDDIVFLIYVVQRFKYPVDPNRKTDTSLGEDKEEKAKKE